MHVISSEMSLNVLRLRLLSGKKKLYLMTVDSLTSVKTYLEWGRAVVQLTVQVRSARSQQETTAVQAHELVFAVNTLFWVEKNLNLHSG